ncbi:MULTISPECIES: hypothetical protein [unclassified Nocardia]|uniref:hypothetical protein n=1 Tax=unclassified Nocardia TaxID=2637762 RepID=UPI0035DF0F64
MTQTENESLSFPPVEPPPFPEPTPPPVKAPMSRRKLAALAGVLPLSAVAVGSAYFVGNSGDDNSSAPKRATGAAVNNAGAITTRSQPNPGVAPEIAKIGSRHIAALHAIHVHLKNIGTYDPRSLDAYFAGAIAASTGPYRKQLQETNTATRAYLLANNSTSEVVDFNCGLRAITDNVATAVGYIKQSTTTETAPNPEVALTVAVVTAEEQPDGRWLISDMQRITT